MLAAGGFSGVELASRTYFLHVCFIFALSLNHLCFTFAIKKRLATLYRGRSNVNGFSYFRNVAEAA